MQNSIDPLKVYPQLFTAVQREGVFKDSKTFADAIPIEGAENLDEVYLNHRDSQDFDLSHFVQKHFTISKIGEEYETLAASQTTTVHIQQLWPHLKKQADRPEKLSSLIPLPYPYIVPGGRFQEIYYWDSYFTMLGLIQDDHLDVVESMVNNFAHLIETYGFIPNGNRTYFLSRSQPPFFSFMVSLLAKEKGENVIGKYLDALLAEYSFWMDGQRCVQIDERHRLNRYWDDHPAPRPESFLEDESLFEKNENDETLYLNLRAACESGWDFSSRWINDSTDLSSIETTQILPIDLNCLLLHLERTIAGIYERQQKGLKAALFHQAALDRVEAIQTYFWDEKRRCFFDYHMSRQTFTNVLSMAAFFPLYLNIANESQASSVIGLLKSELLKPGGWQTTNVSSGQQWDAPNGWPPLQWIAFESLKNYGYEELAKQGARRWIRLNDAVFERTGKMMEKYNVVDLSLDAGGGEYPVQDGFGWTNGVYRALRDSNSFDLEL